MNSVLEFITINYSWFLFASIVILLAIIGYYADKTNFGQGESKDDSTIKNKEINDLNKDMVKKESVIPKDENKINNKNQVQEKISSQPTAKKMPPLEKKESKSEKSFEKFDDKFEKLDKELENLLPQKDIISGKAGDLMDDIDNLTLDKTQKLKLSEIPDLDDVDLPNIKKLSKIDEDVWKKK